MDSVKNPYILAIAIILESLSMYEIILGRHRVVIPGLLYIRLGIRIAPKIPHAGTTLFAAGALMAAYPVSPVFAVLGFVVTVPGVALRLKYLDMYNIDKALIVIFKAAGLFTIYANIAAAIRTLWNAEAFNLTSREYKIRENMV